MNGPKFYMRRDGNEEDGRATSLMELECLVDSLFPVQPRHGIMVELGVFAGEATEMFTRKFDKVYAVDAWDKRCSYGIRSGELPEQIEARFDEVVSRCPNITKLKSDTAPAANAFPDNHFDFVYVDAGHEPDSCRADILAWLQKVKPGGVIAGHDYHQDYPGVIQAVDEIFKTKATITAVNWWVRV